MITVRRDARRCSLPPHAWRWAAIVLAASCGGSITSADRSTPDVAEVVIAPLSATVIVGNSLPLQATVRDASGQTLSGPTVVWSVQDTTVATVSPLGTVTGRSVGSTQVAASVNGKSGLASVTVTPVPVTTVSVSPAHLDLVPGARALLTAVTSDASGNPLVDRPLVWTSSNISVVTVDAAGSLTALANGTATISATSEGRTGSATVTVSPAPVASVTLQPASLTLQRNTSATVTPTLKDASGNVLSGRSITWKSNDTTVARVSSAGVVTALKLGAATITATSEGKSASASIIVAHGPVDRILITPSSVDNLRDRQSVQLAATALDANGDVIPDAIFTWRSSSTYVATVSSTGRVTGEHSGTTTITASFSGRTGSASVRVR